MRFSLVLATKHRVKELQCFLESLAAQTCTDFELILVDQNADDRLAELIKFYSQKFPILHIKQPEPGLSRARNQGLKHVKGELFGFPDDDCIYPADFLAKVSEFFHSDSAWGGLVINVLDLDSDKEAMLYLPESPGVVDYDKGWIVGMTAALFYRGDFALSVQFDENMGPGTPWGGAEDVDYLYSCLDAGAKTYYDPQIIIRHPTPSKFYSIPQSIQREYNHARGAGFLMRKCKLPLSKVFWRITSPLIYTIQFIFQGRSREAACFPGVSLGRLLGYLGSWKISEQ
ncbi:MAG: glycosyltransferase family 2 protein [Nostoc sp.]|uniref:glycosyltransferase family 2 protein n=1 Tax=Nostoc sp. TaxID=1180 RepID=UPI002FF140A5